jgi:hypothetical protein
VRWEQRYTKFTEKIPLFIQSNSLLKIVYSASPEKSYFGGKQMCLSLFQFLPVTLPASCTKWYKSGIGIRKHFP